MLWWGRDPASEQDLDRETTKVFVQSLTEHAAWNTHMQALVSDNSRYEKCNQGHGLVKSESSNVHGSHSKM